MNHPLKDEISPIQKKQNLKNETFDQEETSNKIKIDDSSSNYKNYKKRDSYQISYTSENKNDSHIKKNLSNNVKINSSKILPIKKSFNDKLQCETPSNSKKNNIRKSIRYSPTKKPSLKKPLPSPLKKKKKITQKSKKITRTKSLTSEEISLDQTRNITNISNDNCEENPLKINIPDLNIEKINSEEDLIRKYEREKKFLHYNYSKERYYNKNNYTLLDDKKANISIYFIFLIFFFIFIIKI